MNPGRFHPIRVNRQKCRGCVHCMAACPIQAIRIRGGKAQVIDEWCIDCGECIRFCPHNALDSHTTSFSDLGAFKYKVALPTNALFGQFKSTTSPSEVLCALRQVGFDYVYELSAICELTTSAIEEFFRDHPKPRPLISSACPVVNRLIQRRFPSLCGHILPIEPPRETAAKILRATLPRILGLRPEEIGIIHITPCPAKIVSINKPISMEKSYLDGAISIRDIFPLVLQALKQSKEDVIMRHLFPETSLSGLGMGWALSGGETRGLKNLRTVAVSGVKDTIQVLDRVEAGLLEDVDYLECMVCPDGCVGGPLSVENRFVAKSRILHLVNSLGERSVVNRSDMDFLYHKDFLSFHHPVQPLKEPVLDPDPAQAIQKAKRRDEMTLKLAGKDCGACGAPYCRTLAEDVVRGWAKLADCPFVPKEKR